MEMEHEFGSSTRDYPQKSTKVVGVLVVALVVEVMVVLIVEGGRVGSSLPTGNRMKRVDKYFVKQERNS